MNIEFGNANTLDTHGTGWFLGYGPWAQTQERGPDSLRFMPEDMALHGLCMKWMNHPAADPRGTGKPLSVGRTLSIFVGDSGRFRIAFSEHPDFPADATQEHVLDRPGQFCAWGAGVYHRYEVDDDCTILTLRWVPSGD
jgi:hypothetical protein